ncbi:MAG TPA: PilZ domain-containing protein [Candidatus Sulfotelmatobacter sp.]|nr:PilZ domain-containing protein [Candidatus Sulfotelmatobacter sp.]
MAHTREINAKPRLEMHTLLLCADAGFLGITRNVLHDLGVTPRIVNTSAAALSMIQAHEFETIIVDWREIDNLAEFLCAVRRSKLNQDCVLVAIVRDLLDLKQAFAAGVHFLIHKPASSVQIERCLRAAYCATVARRRKQHRERVQINASIHTRSHPVFEATIVNLSEGGVGVEINPKVFLSGMLPSVGEEIDLRFALPGTGETLDANGRIVWSTVWAFGVKFAYIPDAQRGALERWLTECVERSLAEMCERLRAACA